MFINLVFLIMKMFTLMSSFAKQLNSLVTIQGAYNFGKPQKSGNLRECVKSGKLRETREFKIYSGSLSDAVFHVHNCQ